MAFTFASPSSVFYNKANVKQIDVPSFSGHFGILPNHVPLIAVLKPGVITVHELEGNDKRYFVSSGSVTINEDSSVQILAEEACPVDQLDAQAVRDGVTKAAQDLLSANTDLAKAEAQIALECYDALQKAVEHHH
jgi:F-type H+-transporting ATPase subunit delta